MCGRYVLADALSVLVAQFDAELDRDVVGREFRPNYNVAPSVSIPVITSESGVRLLTQVRWGIVPKWSKTPSTLLINKRGESARHRPVTLIP